MRFLERNSSGFTLIELLVVISIIGFLATLALVSLNTVRAKARDTTRQANARQIREALFLYYNDHSNFPLCGNYESGGFTTRSIDTNWDGCLAVKLAPYIKLPKDVLNVGRYYYYYYCRAPSADSTECGKSEMGGSYLNIPFETLTPDNLLMQILP